MSSKKVLLGVLGGVAAGALLGVLFAPEKGTKIRKQISKKSEDFIDVLKDKFNDLLESMSEKFDEAKENVSDFAEKHGKKESKEKVE